MESDKDQRAQLLGINKQQAKFYEAAPSQRPLNVIMRIWRVFQRRMYFLMQHSGIWADVYAVQREWIGDLKGKKVLDFGCYEGNVLSGYLAVNAASYLGVDLSRPALENLVRYFEEKGIKGARVQCVDVLSKDFSESDFDIIYAQGVLHHFNPIEVLLPVLQGKLAPGGRIVSVDPLQTCFVTRLVRAIYHPFRSDREWEWPFTRSTFTAIRKYFFIKEIQGVVGYSKWAIPISFISKSASVKIAHYFHGKDMAFAKREGRPLWGCMQVVICLQRYEDETGLSSEPVETRFVGAGVASAGSPRM